MLCAIAPVHAWEIAPGVLVSKASVIGDNGGIIFRIMNVNRLKLRFTKCMNYWHSSSISRIAYGRTSNSGRTHVFPEMISDMT
jgi:N6-adenosine-specific RNA methylase IME4